MFLICNVSPITSSKVYRPYSRGTLRLASADVTHTPIVHYNYLSDPRDVRMCVNGVKILSAVVSSKAMSNYTYRQVLVGVIYHILAAPYIPHFLNDDQ